MIFNQLYPGSTLMEGRTNLYKHPDQPVAIRPVSTIAEGLGLGGLLFWDDSGYALYLGDTARAVATSGSYFYTDHKLVPDHRAHPGPILAYQLRASGPDAYTGWPSGAYGYRIAPAARASVGEVRVMGVISQATYGWGMSPTLSHSFAEGARVPYGDPSTRPTIASSAGHQGGAVTMLPLPQRMGRIIREQRALIIEGADDAESYVNQAIDQYLASLVNDGPILYLPLVTCWRKQGQSFLLSIGARSQSSVLHTQASGSRTRLTGGGAQPFGRLPSIAYSSGGGMWESSSLVAIPSVSTYADGRYEHVPEPIFQQPPTNGATISGYLCTFLSRPFHGASISLCGSKVPNFWDNASTNNLIPSTESGYGLMPSSYGGIDTQWSLRGVLPTMTMVPGTGQKATVDWSGSVPLSTLIKEFPGPEIPNASIQLTNLGATPTESEINQRALDADANLAMTQPGPKIEVSWQAFHSPVTQVEQVVSGVYELAKQLAE